MASQPIEQHPCPNHTTHTYTFPSLAHDTPNPSNQQPYFRAMIFFNKKPGLADDFFHSHWKSVHADLTMQVPGAGVDLVRYVQFHQEQRHKDSLSDLIEASGGTMQFVKWDGAAEFWAESAEKFTAFMKSVYGSSHLVGCGTRFVDLVKGYHIMAGYDNVIFGAGVPGVGRDGIMAGNARLNARVESAMGEIIEEKKVRCEKFEAEEKLEEKKFCCDGDEGYVLRSVEP